MTNDEIEMRMLRLFHSRAHTEEETAFIRKHLQRSEFLQLHFVWRQYRKNDAYYGFAIFTAAKCKRRSAIFKSIEIVNEAPINDIMFEEQIRNYGCNTRIMQVYSYCTLQELINDDKLCEIETPVSAFDKAPEIIANVKKRYHDKNIK